MAFDFSKFSYQLLMPSYNGGEAKVVGTTDEAGTVHGDQGEFLGNINGLRLTHHGGLFIGEIVQDGASWKVFDQENNVIYLVRRS